MFPTEIIAGDSYSWLSEEFITGHDMKFYLTKDGQRSEFTAGSYFDDSENIFRYQFNLTPEQTSELLPGEYTAGEVLTGPDFRRTIRTSALVVKPDPLGAAYDARSWLKRILDDLDAVIERRATDAVLDRMVDGTTLRYASLDKLLAIKQKFAALYAQEQNGGIIDLPEEARLTFRGGL